MINMENSRPRCRVFWLDGEKFRTNLYVGFFELPLARKTATKTALLAEVLKQGTQKYPTPIHLAEATEEMYGALWDISIIKKGEKQLLMFSIEVLKCVDSTTVIAFLENLIFHPLTENGVFVKQIVDRQKENVRRRILAQEDDKKAYAGKRCLELMAKGTSYAISADGYIEDLDEIDEASLYGFYRSILAEAEVKVFLCGEKSEKKCLKTFRQWFGGNATQPMANEDTWRWKKPFFAQERQSVEQARLMLGFVMPQAMHPRKRAVALLLNQILGGGADSILFKELREENGLCYDVKSVLYPLSPFLFVQAGIRADDAKKAAAGVLEALEQVEEEGVSEERLEEAKRTILSQYAILSDLPWDMVDFSVNQLSLANGSTDLDKYMRRIKRVDVEEVQALAKQVKLQTIYLLRAKEEENNAK